MKGKQGGKIKQVIIAPTATIKEAIRQLNDNGLQILLVADDENRLMGTITDGDIRRQLMKNWDLDCALRDTMHTSPRFLYESERATAQKVMRNEGILHIPILDTQNRIIDIEFWIEYMDAEPHEIYQRKQARVFILAGGKGTRLQPFTNVLPKPLIPLGETPIIEIIMERFQHFGFNDFILSINYKAEMLRSYFSENPKEFKIEYVKEPRFLGTAGSLGFLKKQIKQSLMVSNCDIILDINLDDLYNHHTENENDATLVGVIRNIKIPYGVMELKEGELTALREKPEYDFIVNAGIYVIEPSVLNLVPDDQYLDMPNLLMQSREQGLKVGVYIVSAEMIDVGHWDEYKHAEEKAKQLGFISS